MHDPHHRTNQQPPTPTAGPADRGSELRDATIAALAAADIDIVHAGDGRPGAVLEPSPDGMGIAVRWQPTDQQPLPGNITALNICRGTTLPNPRQLQNVLLDIHLTQAGLRTAYAGQHLAVLHPNVVIPQTPASNRAAAPTPSHAAAPASPRPRRRLWDRLRPTHRP
ncbi:hypothetical protein ACGF07_34875 [Kitasatospora sp. NPDC048194]|uniref:hypothetical protein n=1 Tax=Kitasatospora sp. NPDC048194 TaxID=3364045 RepID=UPI00370FF610